MKRRLIAMLLALALLSAFVPVIPMQADAAQSLSTADFPAYPQDGHSFSEGFRDNGVWLTTSGNAIPREPSGVADGSFVLSSAINDGDKVIIYSPGHGMAIKDETDRDWYLVSQEITPTGNKIYEPDASLVWTVVDNGNGTYSFKNGFDKIVCWVSESNGRTFFELTNDANYSGADGNWKIDFIGNLAYIKHASFSDSYGPAYIECYYNTGKDKTNISAYSTSDPTKSNDYGWQFYVKTGNVVTVTPSDIPLPTNQMPFSDGDCVVMYNAANGVIIGYEEDTDYDTTTGNYTYCNVTTEAVTVSGTTLTASYENAGTFYAIISDDGTVCFLDQYDYDQSEDPKNPDCYFLAAEAPDTYYDPIKDHAACELIPVEGGYLIKNITDNSYFAVKKGAIVAKDLVKGDPDFIFQFAIWQGEADEANNIICTLLDGGSTPTEPNQGYQLRVYTKDSTFSIQENGSMTFDVRLYYDGNVVQDWKAPALTISNNRQVATAKVGGFHDFAYVVHVDAYSEGTTDLVITDTESGAAIIIPISVYAGPDGIHSFWLKDVPKFYPNISLDSKIETNFYDLDGIYINNLNYTKESDGYHVSFDAYNAGYSHGAVDIYDANGEWKDCEQITKFSDVSGIYDAVEYLVYNVKALIEDGLFAYTSGAITEHSKIEIVVPEGGYFTVSNNIGLSLGAYIYNMADFMIVGAQSVLEAASGVDTRSAAERFAESLKEVVNKNAALRGIVIDQMESIVFDSFKEGIYKNKAGTSMKDLCIQLADATDKYMNLNEMINLSLDVFEGGIETFGGPYGFALKTITSLTKYNCSLMQTAEVYKHIGHPAVYIHAPGGTEWVTISGVSVQGNDAIPDDAILQVFRLYNMDMLEWLNINESDLQQYECELYNICFVKDDQTVSPDGKVTVKIKVPESADKSYFLYREESDGTWTKIQVQYFDGYIIFETDHFSNYGIFYKAPETDDLTPGDLNGDGGVDTVDAIRLAKYLVGLVELTDEQIAAADVTGDGDVTTTDAIRLAKYLVGLVESLKPEPAKAEARARSGIPASRDSR